MNCPTCSSKVAVGTRFCSSCGAELPQLSGEATKYRPPGEHPGATPLSSDAAPRRFSPGDVLASRYRIVERVGTGGMGEVYHAEDLTLEQPVALKFLPQALSRDAARLKRFRREVRTARQITHPNVCRVYDIGEANGQVFLSMEYIDGEDLSSLLRRIGRLPLDRAREVARQLASGLAAAHDKGVLHRDLKPANIMIDGHVTAHTVGGGQVPFTLISIRQ